MPFRSVAQKNFLFAKHPKIARRWAKKYGIPSSLQDKVNAKKKKNGVASKVVHRLHRRIRWRKLKK